jgi:hypothetical protein
MTTTHPMTTTEAKADGAVAESGRVLESALEGEITDHLGYDKHEVAGKTGTNSRNGRRSKIVTTDVGPVEIEVPRDRKGSFEPQIVRKRQRRLSGSMRRCCRCRRRASRTGRSPHRRPSPPSPTRSSTAWPKGRTARWMRLGVSGALPGRDPREDQGRRSRQPAYLRGLGGHR